MELNIIETQEEGLENIPPIITYYYGPKETRCTRKQIILHNNYKFEVLTFDTKGNGTKQIRIFTTGDDQILEDLKISIGYCWIPGFSLSFKNEKHLNSAQHFKFSLSNSHAKKPLLLKDILDRLSTIAENRNSMTSEYPSIQYVYAYIIYLFFKIDEEKISATDFSNYFDSLALMYRCISKKISDNVGGGYFSKDNEFYKKFNLFVKEQMEILKNKPINYYYEWG